MTQADEDARRRRAAERRLRGIPSEVVSSRAAEVPLHDDVTLETRIARAWQLTRRLWSFAGRAIREAPRHELPGEVFDIRAERRRAPG